MIKSNFITDILDLLLDGDKDGKLLRQQIPFLNDSKYDYTGAGLFVTFNHDIGIEKFKLKNDELVLDGVDIFNEADSIEADATAFIKNGLVDSLEIWSKTGEYPKEELRNYTLTQSWNNSPRREIKKTST